MQWLSNTRLLLLPLASLRDADEVKNHKQRYSKGRNQAHWKHRHGAGCDPVRVDKTRSHTHDHCRDQIRDSKQLPEDKTLPVSRDWQVSLRQTAPSLLSRCLPSLRAALNDPARCCRYTTRGRQSLRSAMLAQRSMCAGSKTAETAEMIARRQTILRRCRGESTQPVQVEAAVDPGRS